jgi:cysteine-rich repeat protein
VKASRKCRGAIAKSVLQLAGGGLANITKCHQARDKGKVDKDCNVLEEFNVSTPYGRLVNRLTAVVGNACGADDPVLDNFPDRDVPAILFPAVSRLLEESGEDVQGLPSFVGDRGTIKRLSRCHQAIGLDRNRMVTAIIKRSIKCQKGRDKRATEFGPIAPDCVGAGLGTSQKLAKACGSINGLDVGSCASLPGCVADEATQLAQTLVRIAFGGDTECGNGAEELGEDCDDGNQDPGDSCTNDCTEARCGDGAVHVGQEECDDGNDIPDDTCDDCRNPVCGDGVTAVGVEECDDGNTTANDGCTGCVIDPLFCVPEGIEATVSVPYDPSVPLAGLALRVDYPDVLDVPGVDGTTDPSRVRDLTGLGGFFQPVDRNGALDLTTLFGSAFPSGNFALVHFDCTPGSGVRPRDFTCVVTQASDDQGNDLDDPSIVPCAVESVALPAGVTTTTTTSTTTPTTMSGATTTTTTLGCSGVCGNGTQEGPCETCDDGNTVHNDNCPSDCIVDACTPISASVRAVDVNFAPPVGTGVAGIRVLLDYPEGKVSIPGSGGSVPNGIVTNLPAGASGPPNDLDHALRQLVASTTNMPPGRLFRVNFENCQGAPAPTVGEFSCTVLDATDQDGNDVAGVTCSAVIP